MPSVAAHVGTLVRRTCRPAIWVRAAGRSGGQVYAGQGAGVQGQGAHVVAGVLADEAEGFVGQVHRQVVFFTSCKDRIFSDKDKREAPLSIHATMISL